MSKSNETHTNEGENKMAVFTKPNKFTFAIKAEHCEKFVKDTNTKQENEWVKEKAEIFKMKNLQIGKKDE